MENAKQVLEVSYGSFACRLEGFEDSVETMKTIVAYFHDLAGHDRFMDLEPQAPDMATLARLTEDQSGSNVEIESDGTRLSLRAIPADEASDDADAAPVVDDEEDSFAARLRRVRDVVGYDQPADDEEEDDVAEATVADDEDDEDEAAWDEEAAEAWDEDDLDDEDVEDDDADDDDDDADWHAEDHDDDLDEEAPEVLAEAEAEAETEDSLTAEDVTEEAAPASETAEDADEEPAPKGQNPLARRLSDLARRHSELRSYDASEIAAATEENLSDDDDDEDFDDWDDAEEVDDPDKTRILNPAESAAATAAAAALAAMSAQEKTPKSADLAPESEDDDWDSASDDEEVAADLPEEELAEADDDAWEDDTPEEAADAEEADGRLGPLVLTARDAARDDEPETQEEDFDLHAEVAKVEAEIAARRGSGLARHGLPRSVEDAMSRILSQTNQHLDQPDSRRQRDAFAQLKAAVAATEAARQLGDEQAPVDPGAAFKDDLGAHEAEAEVEAEAEWAAEAAEYDAEPEPAEEPIAAAAPPLKLVRNTDPEEAFDDDDLTEAAPSEEVAPPAPAAQGGGRSGFMDAASARLRQIASVKKDSPADGAKDFAGFAAAHGISDTVDMIEAAAAYLYDVDGEDDFSRPQVMKKVQNATGQEISREDGLRAFGRLLRMNKIVKLPNGRFRISDSSDYRSNGSRAAQG